MKVLRWIWESAKVKRPLRYFGGILLVTGTVILLHRNMGFEDAVLLVLSVILWNVTLGRRYDA